MIKEILKKDAEQEVLLEGLERLVTKILGQNVENMTQYNKNMTTLVQSIKETFQMVETTKEDGTTGVKMVTGAKTAKLTKPAKVPSWTKDLMLETCLKQLQT